MSEKGKLSVGCTVALAVLAIVIIVGIVVGITESRKKSAAIAPFQAHLSEYITISGLTSEPSPEGQYIRGPYIRGKAIIMDTKDNKIDDIFFNLPDDLVAATPEEVGTVVWLKWANVLVGHYTPSGASGYKRTCEVTLIDMLEKAVINKKTFTGSSPPSSKTSGGDAYGSKPTGDVIDYLKSLPRR